MAARVLTFRLPDQEPEPFVDEPDLTSTDVQELASWAQEQIEDFKRAPWSGLSPALRAEKLALARLLIERLEDLESGKVPAPIFGDV